MRVGYIDSLNCYPLYFHMFERVSILGVKVIHGHTGELDMLMKKKRIDLSPVSPAAYPEFQDDTFIFPDFCLNSAGYVSSMVLYSKLPIEELDDRIVGLPSASQTSAVVLKILLKDYYSIKPNYITLDQNPSLQYLDAVVITGSEVMADTGEPVQYSYDLGDLWLRKTGYPVVLAIFAVQKEAVKRNMDLVKRVAGSYEDSLNELRNNYDELVDMATGKYPQIKFNINRFYKLFKYEFTDDLKNALMFYYDKAASFGLLNRVGKIHYF